MLFSQTMNKLTDTMRPSSFLVQHCHNLCKAVISKHFYGFWLHFKIVKYILFYYEVKRRKLFFLEHNYLLWVNGIYSLLRHDIGEEKNMMMAVKEAVPTTQQCWWEETASKPGQPSRGTHLTRGESFNAPSYQNLPTLFKGDPFRLLDTEWNFVFKS